MRHRVHNSPNLIYSPGTQVVTTRAVQGTGTRLAHPSGAVGVIVKSPADRQHAYRVRFADGVEAALLHDELVLLAEFQQGSINDASRALANQSLLDRVIYRCVIGSQAYGLADAASDFDRRGIYLPPAELHWSLYGVPEQLENDQTQEAYWEIQKFIILALKANPNVLECLYTPMVEMATPLAQELLDLRAIFLSRLVFQTYNGYVMSQFKRMQADIRNQGQVKWKHVMHMIRLLLAGITVLREGWLPVQVGPHREALLAIKAGAMPWDEVEAWRIALHREFEEAFEKTALPERPDYERANQFLIAARRKALAEGLP